MRAASCNGTTYVGGRFNVGSVFRLSPPATLGNPWTEAVIYNFNNTGGSQQGNPTGIIMDASGSLYGATSLITSTAAGVVFKLSPPSGGSGSWTETVLHAFTGGQGDGIEPSGPPVLDSQGALYGVTLEGGPLGSGAVYKLSPPTSQGGDWSESVLYSFAGVVGGYAPVAALSFDGLGSLYGVTQYGGIPSCGTFSRGCGTVFKLSPPTNQSGAWTQQLLHAFSAGSDGNLPQAPAIVVGTNVYGTTLWGGAESCQSSGGIAGCGTVFEITQP